MPIVEAQMKDGRWSDAALQIRDKAVYAYANEFYDAAIKTSSVLIRTYLLGHALELYFKAYLLRESTHGSTRLKKEYRHNLEKLFAEANSHGLDKNIHVSPQTYADLVKINQVYDSKSLEYFSLLHLFVPPELPRLNRLFRLAESMRKYLEG